jgi:uncharacterized protein YjbJ (UPF0337 family)
MKRDMLWCRWNQLKAKARLNWGQLTNDDVDQINGERQTLVSKLRERYGAAQERAERDVDEWLAAHHLTAR